MFGAPLTTTATSSSLFGESKTSSTNIFAQASNKDSGSNAKSLFGGASTFKPASTSSLFGSSTGSTSLFGNTTGASLFNKPNIFNKKNDDKEEKKSDDEAGDDCGKDDTPSIVPHDKTTIAAPNSPYTKVLQFEKVDKLKIVAPSTAIANMGQGRLSIERGIIKEKLQYLCVLRSRTGRSLFIGQFSLEHSKKKRIAEKSYRN